MSTAAAKKLALKALQLFPPFRWDDQQENDWIQDVMREIAHFDDAVIEAATTEMVRKRRRKDGTPAVSDCIGYCVEAKRWRDAETGKAQLIQEADAGQHGAWTRDRRKLAYDLIKGPLGKQAAREGWILSLWDFCRNNGRLPSGPNAVREIERCKRTSAEFDEAYAACIRGQGGALNRELEELGASMLAKRERLTAEVMEVTP